MRTRISIAITILIATMLATIGGVSAQGDTPGIDQLVRSFRDANQTGDLVTANDAVPTNPFGGDVQLPPDKIDQVAIELYTAYRLNPSSHSGFEPGGIQIATGDTSDDGSFDAGIFDLPLQQTFIPPFQPGGAPTVESFFDVFFDVPLPDDFGDQFSSGSPFPVDHAVVIPPATGAPSDLNGPVIIRGLRVRGMVPMEGCNGDILEFFTGDAIEGAPLWVPRDFAPNDSFGGVSQAHVTRCVDNMYQPTELLINRGSNFQPAPTNTTAVLFPEGIFWIIPANEVQGSMGMRVGAFLTPQDGGYQQNNVGFTSAPPYPELTLPGSDPYFINNPFPGHTTHPLALTMDTADNGNPGWAGNFGMAFDAEDEAEEPDTFDTHMIQFDSYQLTRGLLTYNPSSGSVTGELTGGGDGYTDTFDFTNGIYTFDPGTPVMYPMMAGPGFDARLTPDMAAAHDARLIASQPPETTSSTGAGSDATTGSTGDSDTGTANDPVEGKSLGATEVGGTNPLFFLLAILLLIAIAGGLWWWFFLKPVPDDCMDEWNAWQKAQRECDEANKTATEKRRAADKATADRKQAEKALKEHCRSFPPACGKQASATDEDTGRTVTRDDLFVQRQWGRDAWSRYGAKTQSAQETQEQWNRPPSEKFRNEQLAKLKDAKAKTPGLKKAAEDAKAAEEAANKAADAAEAAAKKACAGAAAAKKAYDDCIGASAAVADGAADVGEGAAAAGAAVGGIGGAVAGGAAAVGKGAGRNCEPERLAYESAKKACDDATKTASDADSEARAAEKAAETAKDALDKLCEDFPPVCRSDWIQEAGQPETRITTSDLHVGDAWAEKVWNDYQAGNTSAEEASQRWKDGPNDAFKKAELAKVKAAGAKKPGLEKTAKDAKAEADTKRAAADKARAAADDACARAAAARKAWEACQGT